MTLRASQQYRILQAERSEMAGPLYLLVEGLEFFQFTINFYDTNTTHWGITILAKPVGNDT